MADFRMPSLGADMTHGKLIEWRVKPGDAVKKGDIVAVIGTDKADIEVEIFESGVIGELLAHPGQVLPVGAPLATLAGERIEVKASPIARRMARELGIDLASIRGTGPHGVIEKHDIEAAQKPPEQPPEQPAGGMRHAIALAMERSNREIPHYYLATDIEMSRALRWLEAANRDRPLEKRLLPAAIELKAVAGALRAVPELNGCWRDGRFEPAAGIHVGVAISLRTGGLVVPCLLDADKLTLDDTMAALAGLIARARAGGLRGAEITSGTVTVTNLGDLGVEAVWGVIYPPQVALVGFGRIAERPWAENGLLGVRPVLTATLAGDHRATDGRRGAQFLTKLADLLQHPEAL